MTIRPVRDSDLAAILAFWNPLIRETTITFSSEEKTAEGLTAMIAARRSMGREFLVAEIGGAVLGFASYDQFRAGNGYVHAMEHTVILAPEAHGRGLGRVLMAGTEDHAKARGAHVMVAGVSGENAVGIAFHRALGYAQTGVMPQTGRKFGRWLDLVLMQKQL
ncbi:GNAT family N-acetyltransferase [Paracoccus lutimaris]|uniref:Phosphinothricin acetyltransferase n=1 Tax=Paracoccus lutimaris TaxID=1490030 RepID=A0A368ZBY1_9RHOB|nr:GNAT family N-acetyltransferase [Paracoccus lutimaris]RCW88687.1 phosphinothricin acetyltransferase [Paracoccus lutimaris]